MAVAPEVLLMLGGKKYLSAIYVMPPVAMGCICQFLYTMFVNVEQIKKKTVGMAFASVSAAALNYILNLIFIPRFGYVAAAYTTLVGYIWLLLVHMFLVYRMKMSEAYSYSYVFLTVGVVGIYTLVVNILYTHQLIRYCFLALYLLGMGGIAYFNRRNILSIIQVFLPGRKKKGEQ